MTYTIQNKIKLPFHHKNHHESLIFPMKQLKKPEAAGRSSTGPSRHGGGGQLRLLSEHAHLPGGEGHAAIPSSHPKDGP